MPLSRSQSSGTGARPLVCAVGAAVAGHLDAVAEHLAGVVDLQVDGGFRVIGFAWDEVPPWPAPAPAG